MSLGTTDATALTMTYNNALRPTSYLANNSVEGDIQDAAYTYNNDGMTKDITNNLNSSFSQTNEYDFAGRLKKNKVGTSGNGGVFSQTMKYDAFNNLTKRDNTTWGNFTDGFETTYLNHRKVPYTGGTTDNYDYAGNVVKSEFTGSDCLLPTCRTYNDTKKWNFDAAGRMTYSEHTGPWETHTNHENITYDGDGRAVKRDEVTQEYSIMWYYIYSSVTGQKITDLINDYYVATHIYMGGSMIAEEYNDNKGGGFAVFNLTDPVTGSLRKIGPDGTSSGDDSDGIYPTRTEMAGMGMSVPLTAPQSYPLPPRHRGYTGDAEGGCIIQIDGFEVGRWNCSHSDLAGADTSMDYLSSANRLECQL